MRHVSRAALTVTGHDCKRFNKPPVVMHVAPGYWAGDPRLFHLECWTLERAGYHVELVAHAAPEEECQYGLNFYSLGSLRQPSWKWRILARLRRSYRAYLLAKKSEAAIFHIHSPEFIVLGSRLARRMGRKVIFDCREDFEGYVLQRNGIPAFLRKSMAVLVRKQLEWASSRYDAVVVADRGTGRRFEGRARRLVILHNFPRLELFPYEVIPDEQKSFDVVYHGSIPKSHLETLLGIDEALLQLGLAVRWRLINKGAPHIEWFLSELRRRDALARFTVDGRVPHEQIAGEIRKARIGIIPLADLPKFRNNIPRKLFEFMALGMPVVMSDLPPSRAFVRDGRTALLVPPNDCRAYADAIRQLLNDSPLRYKMGAEARKLVEMEFNWQKESEKLLGLYADLTAD